MINKNFLFIGGSDFVLKPFFSLFIEVIEKPEYQIEKGISPSESFGKLLLFKPAQFNETFWESDYYHGYVSLFVSLLFFF